MAKGNQKGPVDARRAPQSPANAGGGPKPASDAEKLAFAVSALRQVASHLVSRAEGDTALAGRIFKMLGDG